MNRTRKIGRAVVVALVVPAALLLGSGSASADYPDQSAVLQAGDTDELSSEQLVARVTGGNERDPRLEHTERFGQPNPSFLRPWSAAALGAAAFGAAVILAAAVRSGMRHRRRQEIAIT